MNTVFRRAAALFCSAAVLLALSSCGAKSTSESASSSASAASSEGAAAHASFGSAADFDYKSFRYSDNIDDRGYWEGVRALDHVTLPEGFPNLPVKLSEIDPSEEDVDGMISQMLSMSMQENRITDRPCKEGDRVVIDYAGTVYDIAFSGGTAQDVPLVLGSGSFIDGFEGSDRRPYAGRRV